MRPQICAKHLGWVPHSNYHKKKKKIIVWDSRFWWAVTVSSLTHVGTKTECCLFVKKVFPLGYSVTDSVSCATQLGNWPQINYCLFYFRSQIHWWKHRHNIKLFLYELSDRIHFYICTCIEQCWHPVCRVQTGTWSD